MRMRTWVAFLNPDKRTAVPYEAMLPIEDFQNLSNDPVPTWDALA